MEFNVGDRVVVIKQHGETYPPVGEVGTVRSVTQFRDGVATVEFDTWEEGHDGYMGLGTKGYWILFSELELEDQFDREIQADPIGSLFETSE